MKGNKAPVYVVKPKNIFKHPFNKFDLEKPSIRETQNEDLTDYFNYGFNQDTMNIYGKLVKRAIETLDEGINPTYFDQPSELMRLNDQIPMDFGGFCKFFDNSVFVGYEDSESSLINMEDFHNGEELLYYFILQILTNRPEYPLIDFVKSLYEVPEDKNNGSIYEIKAEIQLNLAKQYEKILAKLQEKKNATTPTQTQKARPKSKQRSEKQESESASGSQESESSESESQSSSSPEKSRKRRKERSREKSRKERRSHRQSSRKEHRRRSNSRELKKKKSSKSHRYRSSSRDRKKESRKSRNKSKERRDKKKRRH